MGDKGWNWVEAKWISLMGEAFLMRSPGRETQTGVKSKRYLPPVDHTMRELEATRVCRFF